MDYYNGKNQLDKAMAIVDTALISDKDNVLFLFAKSNILLNMGSYQECVTVCDTILKKNNSFPDVYYNAGVSYLNLAIDLEKTTISKRKIEHRL